MMRLRAFLLGGVAHHAMNVGCFGINPRSMRVVRTMTSH